jgi:hypothetical protein
LAGWEGEGQIRRNRRRWRGAGHLLHDAHQEAGHPGRAVRALAGPGGQQLGASLLNTIFASAVTSHIALHVASARVIGRQALTGLALAHGPALPA